MMLDGLATTVRVSLVNYADAWMERRRGCPLQAGGRRWRRPL